MTQTQEIKEIIDALVSKDSDVLSHAAPSAKAYVIHSKYDISRTTLCEYFKIANSSISRAKQAMDQGFDPGRNARHHILSSKDEHTLERWIHFLIDISETVYSSTLIELVCCFFRILSFLSIGQ